MVVEKLPGRVVEENENQPRIGLALSGGGFRAAIFHLGVIRRLEELGIMMDVDVISTVSGGSIIGAYYLCEMERRLRDYPAAKRRDVAVRIAIFNEIARDFLKGVDRNLRTRALVFTPFYHPWLFLKTLVLRAFRAGARSELIQKEYDTWFYKGNTLDQLPAVTDRNGNESGLAGPKLILNTTSLLTGERVSFSREAVSGMAELSKVNRNILPLSRIVGASSAVPVLFPPTGISADLLVDGGVSDNQGIEALLNDGGRCDLLLISDASGQMEQLNATSTRETTVYARTNAILQHQVRSKLLQLLLGYKSLHGIEFAFVHLFLNLKDRPGVTHRVSSEFIPEIGRLRTDLDQFSFIEREALMYHGYTLIDAQLFQHCSEFMRSRFGIQDKSEASRRNWYASHPMAEAPLFREVAQRSEEARAIVRTSLKAGKRKMFLARAVHTHGVPIATILGVAFLAAIALFVATLEAAQGPLIAWKSLVTKGIASLIPGWAQDWIASPMIDSLGVPWLRETIAHIGGSVAVLLLLAIYCYGLFFVAYNLVRRSALRRDRLQYRAITGEEPDPAWPPAKTPHTPVRTTNTTTAISA